MRITRLLLILIGAFILPLTAFGQSVYSDTYVIPIAGHTAGANGSLWMTDVAITNFAATPLNVQLVVVETGENNFDNVYPLTTDTINGSVVVPANGSVLLKDVLSTYRGRQNSTGALIIGGDKPFAVTARIYNGGTGGNSIGTTVTPARDFFENSTGRSDNSAVAIVPGITNNGSARTNIGFLAGTGSAAGTTLGVQVTIRNASGTVLGTKLVSVPPGNFTQTQFSVASITNTPFDIGSAEFRIVQGLGAVVPYASVVDNATNSAAYIMGQFPPSTPITGATGILQHENVFRALLDAMRQSSGSRQ